MELSVFEVYLEIKLKGLADGNMWNVKGVKREL
jgi:hypothetical protein